LERAFFPETGAAGFVSSAAVSKRVVIICLFLCLVGILFGLGLSGLWITGLWGRPEGWLPTLLYAGGFLCLPAGMAMMLGYPFGRVVAVVAFVVGYLACAAILAAPWLGEGAMHISINGSRAGFEMHAFASLLLLGIVMLLHWTLYTPSFEDHLS
jgi:hypothetical protein